MNGRRPRFKKPAVVIATPVPKRARSGVMQLRQAGAITDADVASAERWHMDFALAMASPSTGGTGTTPDDLIEAASRAIATMRYHAACRVVGSHGTALLRMYVAARMSFVEISKKTNQNRKEIGGMVGAILERLTEHYEVTDNARSET
jgi:hypothetical protein